MFAAPPPGLHAGPDVLRAGAECGGGTAVVSRERAAAAGRAGPGERAGQDSAGRITGCLIPDGCTGCQHLLSRLAGS
jgi:hypothetical protein